MVRENIRDINGQYHGKEKHTRHQDQDTRYGKAYKTSWAGYMVWGRIQDIMGKKYGIESMQNIMGNKHGMGKHSEHHGPLVSNLVYESI